MRKITIALVLVSLLLASQGCGVSPSVGKEAGLSEQQQRYTLGMALETYEQTMKGLTELQRADALTEEQTKFVLRWKDEALAGLRLWSIKLRQDRDVAAERQKVREALTHLQEVLSDEQSGNDTDDSDGGEGSSGTGGGRSQKGENELYEGRDTTEIRGCRGCQRRVRGNGIRRNTRRNAGG